MTRNLLERYGIFWRLFLNICACSLVYAARAAFGLYLTVLFDFSFNAEKSWHDFLTSSRMCAPRHCSGWDEYELEPSYRSRSIFFSRRPCLENYPNGARFRLGNYLRLTLAGPTAYDQSLQGFPLMS